MKVGSVREQIAHYAFEAIYERFIEEAGAC